MNKLTRKEMIEQIFFLLVVKKCKDTKNALKVYRKYYVVYLSIILRSNHFSKAFSFFASYFFAPLDTLNLDQAKIFLRMQFF